MPRAPLPHRPPHQLFTRLPEPRPPLALPGRQQRAPRAPAALSPAAPRRRSLWPPQSQGRPVRLGSEGPAAAGQRSRRLPLSPSAGGAGRATARRARPGRGSARVQCEPSGKAMPSPAHTHSCPSPAATAGTGALAPYSSCLHPRAGHRARLCQRAKHCGSLLTEPFSLFNTHCIFNCCL